MFLIVQPYAAGRDRFVLASVVGEYGSVTEAYAALDAMHARLREQQIPVDALDLQVVDDRRRPVRRPRRSPRDPACHADEAQSSPMLSPSRPEFPQPFISSDPGAWMRPIYADVARRPGFATWSTQHQFNALVDAIAVEYPQEAAKMRDDGPTTQRAILGLLADMTRQKPAARQVELWVVRKGEHELRAVAVYLPSGIDLRLVAQDEFRRTTLCRDAPQLHARAADWKAKLLRAGWEEAPEPPAP